MLKKRGLSEVIGLVLILGITVVISFVIYFYFRSIDIIPSETCPDEVSIRLDEARYVERVKYDYVFGSDNTNPYYSNFPSFYSPELSTYSFNTGTEFSKINREEIVLNITNIGFYSIKGVYARIKVNNNAKEETIALFNKTGGTELLFDSGLKPGESEKIRVLKDRVDKNELTKQGIDQTLEWWDYDIESLVVIPIVNITSDDGKTESVTCKDSSLKTQNLLKLRRPYRDTGGTDPYSRTTFESCGLLLQHYSQDVTVPNALRVLVNRIGNDVNSLGLDQSKGDCKEKFFYKDNTGLHIPIYDQWMVAKNNTFSCYETEYYFDATTLTHNFQFYTEPQMICLNGRFYEVIPDTDRFSFYDIWNPVTPVGDYVEGLIPGTRIGDFMADPDYENGFFYQVVRN